MIAVPLVDQLSDTQLYSLRIAIEEWAELFDDQPVVASADGVPISAREMALRVPLVVNTTAGPQLAGEFIDDEYADMLAFAVAEQGYDTLVRAFANVAGRRGRP